MIYDDFEPRGIAIINAIAEALAQHDITEALDRYDSWPHRSLHDAINELHRLRTLEEQLPRTADGKAIIPHANGHHVWWVDSYGNAYWNRNVVQGGDGLWYAYNGWMPEIMFSEGEFDPDFNTCRPLSECWSTRDLAVKAREENP